MSYSIAKSVAEPLDRIEKKTGEINAGDFGSELALSDIRELADLASSINLMSTRLKSQFVDLPVASHKKLLQTVFENHVKIYSKS